MRRAIGLAIDKTLLVREVTFGTTVPATEDLPSFMWAFDPKAGTTARDLPRANALLDAAGWKRGPDGVRVKNGKRFSMGLSYRTDSITDRNRGVLIDAMLKDAGIETELKGYTTSLLYGPPGVGIQADGKFDASLQTWYAGSDPDDSTQLTCDQVAPKGYNWTRYCSAAMDAAQRVALAHYDRPTRKRAYATDRGAAGARHAVRVPLVAAPDRSDQHRPQGLPAQRHHRRLERLSVVDLTIVSKRAQVVEGLAIDRPVVAHAVLEVFDVHERDQRGARRLVEFTAARRERADAGELGHDLAADGVVDRQHVLRRGGEVVELVQLEQARQLVDRRRVIVDAQVDVAVVEAAVTAAGLDHDQRRALLAALVAARALSRRSAATSLSASVPPRVAERRWRARRRRSGRPDSYPAPRTRRR